MVPIFSPGLLAPVDYDLLAFCLEGIRRLVVYTLVYSLYEITWDLLIVKTGKQSMTENPNFKGASPIQLRI